jgi:hypothetical protein
LTIGDVTLKVVPPTGLILLKLYAGGSKDAWDIQALLEAREDSDAVRAEVDRLVDRLPAECSDLWRRLQSRRA